MFNSIQKLGLALDENSTRNKQRSKNGRATYKEQLEALQDKRIVFIFDECHRSQFGENHKAIKAFFPKAQLFGFTGTPIFGGPDGNATRVKIDGEVASYQTTEELFQKQLHAYTITHAIEDGNVLRFHVDYFKPKEEAGKKQPKPGEALAKRAVIDAILAKHDAATGGRRFNAILATASINDAIEYHALFKTMQAEKLAESQAADPDFKPLNIACVFSPPAALAENEEARKDINQLASDLQQELEDNKVEPEKKKLALEAIVADYNARYGSSHRLSEFDLYYQDVQKRIKDQQWPEADLRKAFPNVAHHKIDITIVVDMLLTGFDSKYLNTLYVDKNLKHHGLIQAFSRTNRVLNGTKPYGNVLDFRQQQDAVDAAIGLFSGQKSGEQAREIWLVDKAPVVIEKLQTAVQKLDEFMSSQGLACAPSEVANLKGDAARAAFVTHFKEVQRLKKIIQRTRIALELSGIPHAPTMPIVTSAPCFVPVTSARRPSTSSSAGASTSSTTVPSSVTSAQTPPSSPIFLTTPRTRPLLDTPREGSASSPSCWTKRPSSATSARWAGTPSRTGRGRGARCARRTRARSPCSCG